MVKEKLAELMTQRESIKSKLNNFLSYVNKIKDELDNSNRELEGLERAQLEIKQDKLNDLYSKFDKLQDKIEIDTPVANLQNELTFRNEFDDEICKVLSIIKLMLENSKHEPLNRSPSVNQGSLEFASLKSVKLPTIDLPKFEGNYNKWLEFRDTFRSVIHHNNALDDILKIQYLRSSLEGDAAKLISFLETSGTNYHVAWDLLCERYNKPRLLVNNHMKALFGIKPLVTENARDIRNIVNEVNQHLRALELLEQPIDAWDSILIHLVTSKLDSVTLRDWESKIKDNELPTKAQFFTFLNEKADTLETLNATAHSRPHFKQTSYRTERNYQKGTTKVYLTTNNARKCSFCKNEHNILGCNELTKLSVDERIRKAKAKGLCINCLRAGHFIRECRSSLCRKCGHKHHTLLHIDKQPQNEPIKLVSSMQADPVGATSARAQSHTYLNQSKQETTVTLLATAEVGILDVHGRMQTGRALLDSGSQTNLITSELCNLLGLKTSPAQISLSGVGTVSSKVEAKCFTMVRSKNSNYHRNLSFLVTTSICDHMPNFRIKDTNIPIPQGIDLADPHFRVPAKIDILLGASVFWQILELNQVKLGENLPILQKTKLGYIITGPVAPSTNMIFCNFLKTRHFETNTADIQTQISKFWEVEECAHKPGRSAEEIECEEYFARTTRRGDDGRFIVAIPLKGSIARLGDSKQRALNQLHSLEKKLEKNQTLKVLYNEFMQEYLDLGHMTETCNESSTIKYFMPHHGVLKDTNLTTKLRVVFNASSVSTSGLALNDLQMVGPTIQSDLFEILIRFREYAYVACADISKMYRQILIEPEQRPLQTILWRFSPDQPIKEYVLNTVTYGTASAPYLAIRCLVELAVEHAETNPMASLIIREDMYVDDLITGHDDISELTKTCNTVKNILQSGGFTLRKWKSNERELINNIEIESNETFLKLGQEKQTKTLGVLWSCQSDNLTYSLDVNIANPVTTKRVLLSKISQIFDPLGLIGACTIIAKILLQSLWLEKLSWDDPVPQIIHDKWRKFETELTKLNSIQIPRYISIKYAKQKEIHTFCDASQDAYGACVYVRSIDEAGEIVCNLLCAKSKVAPLKPLSTPRLELCAAVIASRLTNKVVEASRGQFDSCTLWSDSTIVLAWVKTAPNRLKCFVSNRVTEIQNLTKSCTWRYINTKENPADLLSRGVSPAQIQNAVIWWHGPSWLREESAMWPKAESSILSTIPEIKANVCTLTQVDEIDIFSRFSDITRMKRVLAYCLRFRSNCIHRRTGTIRKTDYLTERELNTAFNCIIRNIQEKSFPIEYKCLSKNKDIPNASKLLNLKPFLDQTKLLRVGGRLQGSPFEYDKKHPIILPKSHVTELILKKEHCRLLHAGPQQVLYSIRERFWPISGRTTVRKVTRQCVTCFKAKPIANTPLMANLPSNRVTKLHPFMITGVDYGGPFNIKCHKGRGTKQYKAYIALFVCFVTKAIHMELVTDLTKDGFIAAFRRFAARRGVPAEMNSDNGTNFIGANNELKELGRFITGNKTLLEHSLNAEGMQWRFLPPRSPHMGGLWEAGVRSAKYHIKRVAGKGLFTYEEFSTLLNQIEAVLNSRPLSVIPSDPEDPIPLTPSHFLIGRSLMSPPDPDLQTVPENRLSVYQRIQQLQQHFWTRWSKEYISDLQQRTKWKTNCKNLEVGTVVLIKEDNTPPLSWPMGIVTTLHPGVDGISRVATVRTNHGLFKRPVVRLCPLPTSESA